MIYLFVTPDFVESQISRILVTIFLTVCMGGALREMYREINNTELDFTLNHRVRRKRVHIVMNITCMGMIGIHGVHTVGF